MAVPNLAHNPSQTAGKRSSRETEVQLKVRGAEGGTLRTQSYVAACVVCLSRVCLAKGVHGVGSALGESGVKELW